MNNKYMLCAILLGSLLVFTPSISAVEYHVVVEKNTQQLIDKIKTIDIDTLEKDLKSINSQSVQDIVQKIDFQTLKDKITTLSTSSPYIDFKLILIVIMDVVTTMLYGTPSLMRFITTVLCSIVIIQEFVTGENLMWFCSKVDALLVLSVFMTVGGFEWRIIQNKSLAILFIIITNIIGRLIASTMILSNTSP